MAKHAKPWTASAKRRDAAGSFTQSTGKRKAQ